MEKGGAFLDIFKGERKDYPPSAYDFLQKNGNRMITAITVIRTPLAKSLLVAMNAMALGRWGKKQKELGFDTFYHLGMILTLDGNPNATVMLQKNEVIDLGFRKMPDIDKLKKLGGGTMVVRMKEPIQLSKFMSEAQRVLGDKYFTYNPLTNNCQAFVLVNLRSNRLLTPELREFIFQKINKLVESQSGFFKSITPAITKLGSIFSRGKEGDTDKSQYIEPDQHKHDQTKDYPTHTMENGNVMTENPHSEFSFKIGNENDKPTDKIEGGSLVGGGNRNTRYRNKNLNNIVLKSF